MSSFLDALTPDAVHSLEMGVNSARARHNPYLDSEHLLLGALSSDLPQQALQVGGLPPDELMSAVITQMSVIREEPLTSTKGLTSEAKLNLAQAGREAHQMGHSFMGSGHILLGVLQRPSPFLEEIFKNLPKFDTEKIRAYVQANAEEPSGVFNKKWRPATWEYANVFAGVGVPSGSNPPIRGTATSSARPASSPIGSRPASNPTSRPANRPTARPIPRTAQQQRGGLSTWQTLLIAAGVVLMVAYGAVMYPDAAVPFIIVFGGWIGSLILHEFAHALVAYWGGDYTVVEKGYLTLNPFKYVHPVNSIIFPLIILMAGGIGLPGGAVFIETHRLRSKWWRIAVAAAGPFANFICLIIFSAPFWSGLVSPEQFAERANFWYPVALLVFLQVTAIMFNLLPIPPLDGFHIIEPFLPEDIATSLRSLGFVTLFFILIMFRLPAGSDGATLGREFYDQAIEITENFEVERGQIREGFIRFRFWDNNN